MTFQLTAREAEYVKAWALAIESAKPEDRRMVAIFAMAVLGNVDVVRCAAHGMPRDLPMTFTEAFAHTLAAPSRCSFDVDVRATR